ncbi:MAG: hypothetical protein JWN63_3634 [Candidatus Acidoferrum typicum]|nr:hypothetical protein [Candidatus Acidoferrum typicum]
MSPVVIHHQVQGNVSRKLLVESAEKHKKLLVSMPLGYGARNSPKGILGPRLCCCIQCILCGPKNAIFASLRYWSEDADCMPPQLAIRIHSPFASLKESNA